jgi:tetratricopeptide (TPR) repeat protein
MWGNRTGWSISGVIAAIMIGLMYLLHTMGAHAEMTPKFAADPKNLDALALTPAPETVLTTMTDACDAADKYREAIALYESSPAIYSDPKKLDLWEATDKVSEATHCKDLTIFSKNAASVINFDREKTPIETLRKLGEATANRALAAKAAKNPDDARKYAEAAFSLGAKMYNERVVYEEFDAGLGIMGAAAYVMVGLAHDSGDQARADQIQAFVDARRKFSDKPGRIYDLHMITKTIDGKISSDRAGDVFALAEKSKERMWRVEACLQLARTHRFVGEEGHSSDQRYAQAVLMRLADKETDPIVKLAATRARDITDQEYNRQ